MRTVYLSFGATALVAVGCGVGVDLALPEVIQDGHTDTPGTASEATVRESTVVQSGFSPSTTPQIDQFDFASVRIRRLALQVVDPRGNPLFDASVVVHSGEGAAEAVVFRGRTNRDGRLALELVLPAADAATRITVSKPFYHATSHHVTSADWKASAAAVALPLEVKEDE